MESDSAIEKPRRTDAGPVEIDRIEAPLELRGSSIATFIPLLVGARVRGPAADREQLHEPRMT